MLSRILNHFPLSFRALVCTKYLGNTHRYSPTHTPDIHLHEVIDKHLFLLLKEGDGPQEPIHVLMIRSALLPTYLQRVWAEAKGTV